VLSKLLERQTNTPISYTDWAKMFTPGGRVSFNGNTYQAYQTSTAGGSESGHYTTNSVVFACAQNRMLLFSEARFQYQRFDKGRPTDLFADPSLQILEEPWTGGHTRDLLLQAELDVFTSGNSYWIRDDSGLVRLDPSKVVVATQGAQDPVSGAVIGERLLGYYYKVDGKTLATYTPEMVGHYKPHLSPSNPFVGQSWLSAALPDVAVDTALTKHKASTVGQGGNLGYVVTLDASLTKEQFDFAVDKYREQHEGPSNAGKTLFLSGGSDVKTVGQSFENMAMKATQGAGETRIAACAGVPPVIVGLSEGLSSATYSNYSQARRRLVDGTMRPLWGIFAGAMQSLVPVPSKCRLWYDDRDIPFLREDVMDQAEIMSRRMLTVESGVRAGYTPDSVAQAVDSGDLTLLVHTGLFSVQLQPPMPDGPPPPPPAASATPQPSA
jgi:phage portal protein BeeE